MNISQMPDILKIFDDVWKLGGVLSIMLLFALLVVWKKYQTAMRDIAALNKSIQADAMQNIKIIDAAMNTLDGRNDINEEILKKSDEILDIIKNRKITVQ